MSDTRIRFPLGQVLATPGALQALADSQQSAHELVRRHQSGDWGLLSVEDCRANEMAVADGSRILSAYETGGGIRIWIITEAADSQGNRAATTLLLPEEY